MSKQNITIIIACIFCLAFGYWIGWNMSKDKYKEIALEVVDTITILNKDEIEPERKTMNDSCLAWKLYTDCFTLAIGDNKYIADRVDVMQTCRHIAIELSVRLKENISEDCK